MEKHPNAHLDTKYSCYIYTYMVLNIYDTVNTEKGSIKINIHESLIQLYNNELTMA